MAVAFNGIERFIEVTNPADIILDVQKDLYSTWKLWQQASTVNAGYAPAFRTFGGDTTVTGQNAPRYFFLTNGWRVRINNGQIVTISLNLYSDDYPSPYVVVAGSGVSDRNSDAVVVTAGGGGGDEVWTVPEKDEVIAYAKKASDNAEQVNNKIN